MPLAVIPVPPDLGRELLEVAQGRNFLAEFLDRACCRCFIGNLAGTRLELVAGCILEVVDIVIVHLRTDPGNARATTPLDDLFLTEFCLKPFLAPAERLVDGLRGRREPPLQDGECEPDCPGTAVLTEGFGAVELLANVLGDLRIELGATVGQVIGDRVGTSFGKEGLAFEGQELFLHDPAHQVIGVGNA